MAIAWTHTVEERLGRLERRHEQLLTKVTALGQATRVAQEPRAKAQSQAIPRPHVPPTVRVVDPAVQPANQPRPIGGGQLPALATRPSLGMWTPPRLEGGQLGRRDRQVQVKQHVDALTTTARHLSSTVQRLESMVLLLGQVVTLATDPQARAAGMGPGNAAGGLDLGGLLGAAAGISPAATEGTGAQGGPQGGGAEAVTGQPNQLQGLAAMVPLLQQVLTRGQGGANLGAVVSSPAFQQLAAMAGGQSGR